MNECRADGGIHAATHENQDTGGSDSASNLLAGQFSSTLWGVQSLTFGNPEKEISEDIASVLRQIHFGMKLKTNTGRQERQPGKVQIDIWSADLHSKQLPVDIFDADNQFGFHGFARDPEPRGNRLDTVAVREENSTALGNAFERQEVSATCK